MQGTQILSQWPFNFLERLLAITECAYLQLKSSLTNISLLFPGAFKVPHSFYSVVEEYQVVKREREYHDCGEKITWV